MPPAAAAEMRAECALTTHFRRGLGGCLCRICLQLAFLRAARRIDCQSREQILDAKLKACAAEFVRIAGPRAYN